MRIQTTLEAMRAAESYDWPQVFKYAEGTSDGYDESGGPYVATNAAPAPRGAPFGLDDVAEVLASAEGEGDGPDWLALVRLADGRFGFVWAGCDYTGWG